MAEKDVDEFEKIFHETAQLVHIGGYWGGGKKRKRTS